MFLARDSCFWLRFPQGQTYIIGRGINKKGADGVSRKGRGAQRISFFFLVLAVVLSLIGVSGVLPTQVVQAPLRAISDGEMLRGSSLRITIERARENVEGLHHEFDVFLSRYQAIESTLAHLQKEIRRANSRLGDDDVELLAKHFFLAGEDFDLSPFLLLAQCILESRLSFDVVSRTNDWGMSQFQPRTAEWVAGRLEIPFTGPEMMFDPAIAIKFQAYYLRHAIDTTGSLGYGLRYYNGGPSFLLKPVTIRYQKLVLAIYSGIRSRVARP